MDTIIQNDFNTLMKEEKNNDGIPAVMRFILSAVRETIRKNWNTDGFIWCHGPQQNMANSNNGNQRFVNAAYRYIEVNGRSSVHEITDWVHNNHAAVSHTEIGQASSLMALHPMFRRDGKKRHRGPTNTYEVTAYDIVPVEVLVAKLAAMLHRGTSMRFAFKKYPAFIRDRVTALLDSPTFNLRDCDIIVDTYNESLKEI